MKTQPKSSFSGTESNAHSVVKTVYSLTRKKTKLLVLGTPQLLMKVPDDLSITLLSKEITSSKSAKNLGVTMDCNLTYDEHITQLTSKCIGSLCQINRVKHLFDRRTLITIIHSLVFSKLLYCSSVWANTTKKNIELFTDGAKFCSPDSYWNEEI